MMDGPAIVFEWKHPTITGRRRKCGTMTQHKLFSSTCRQVTMKHPYFAKQTTSNSECYAVVVEQFASRLV